MKRSVIIPIALVFLLISACSCAEKKTEGGGLIYLKTSEVENTESDIQPFAELSWGSGDGQVAFMNELLKDNVEVGRGPGVFCIDQEGNCYIDDRMNIRFMKIGTDGEYVASVPKDRFSVNVNDPIPSEMTNGIDSLILYDYGGSIIQRYNFERDEIETIDLAEEYSSPKPYIVDVISDEKGVLNIFSSEHLNDSRTEYILYRVDATLKNIIEKRELPGQARGIDAVDASGNLYYGTGSDDRSSYQVERIDRDNAIHKQVVIEKAYDEGFDLLAANEGNEFTLIRREAGRAWILRISAKQSFQYGLPYAPRIVRSSNTGVYFDSYLPDASFDDMPQYCIHRAVQEE